MFGNVTVINVYQQYGANPTSQDIANLAAQTINLGGNPYVLDFTDVTVTTALLQTFTAAMTQYNSASHAYMAPSAYVRFKGLPAWATEWLAVHANPAGLV